MACTALTSPQSESLMDFSTSFIKNSMVWVISVKLLCSEHMFLQLIRKDYSSISYLMPISKLTKLLTYLYTYFFCWLLNKILITSNN